MDIKNKVTFVLVALVIGAYYSWGARSAGYPFNWDKDQPGYYNYLARGFATGHLYLPIDPSPQLLAQPNPWNPKVDDSLKLFDAVLFNRRYYLYHGAGPALLLFAPYRIITGRDLPENFALYLLCFGGFLFSAGSLLAILRLAELRPGPILLGAMFFALGICQGVPFLLSRVWVYELAVGGGYFCLSAAFFCFLRGLLSNRLYWPGAAGFMFGMAVACRPHLAIAGAVAVMATAIAQRQSRRLIALIVPFVLIGAGIASYNYQRFGNPLEFGTKWQLAGVNQGRVTLSAANVVPGAYYLLAARPEFSPVFPWVTLSWPPREFPRPPEYYLEQTVGALWLAPFLTVLPAIAFLRRTRFAVSVLSLSGAGILLFVALTGWSTQRYEVDFIPLLALAALAGSVEILASAGRMARAALSGLLGSTIIFGCIVNLALGISGPYWEMIKNKPMRFVKIAGWFSPMKRHRPATDRIDITFRAVVKALPDHVRDKWLTAARFPWNYELYVEHFSGKPRLISSYGGTTVDCDIDLGISPAEFRLTYAPDSAEVLVTRNGVEILRHAIGPFVTAPSQIAVTAPAL